MVCGFSTGALSQASRSYSICLTAASEWSMQSQLFLTICSPFLM